MKRIKTILWATLTANGNYARATAERPPRPEALADFAAQATAAGNFIAGRRTFEAFQTDTGRKVEDAERAFAGQPLPLPHPDAGRLRQLIHFRGLHVHDSSLFRTRRCPIACHVFPRWLGNKRLGQVGLCQRRSVVHFKQHRLYGSLCGFDSL